MSPDLEPNIRNAFFSYILRLGDDLLVLGHRLSEWCGHAPILEEDVALANIALDCIGQAEALLALAGELEGKSRNEDDLAYFRDEYQFRNLQLVEQPNGDFAMTLTRQFLFDALAYHLYEALRESPFEPLAGIAAKVFNESRYHLRHSRLWMIRLGDGTEESNRRTQQALDALWTHTGELFYTDEVDRLLLEKKFIPDARAIRELWRQTVAETLKEATLILPDDSQFMIQGGREGKHSEHLGHMLAQMQILARSHPGARW